MNKQQAGFTLIELVMVIVILGILAATALPRFANLETSAREGVLQGARGALQSSAVILYAQTRAANPLASITANTALENVTVGGTCAAVNLTYTGTATTASFAIDSTLCNG